MKAIVYERFGSPDILRYQDVEKPTPGENEVLIKVRAASINPLDWKLMKGGPFPVRILLGLGKRKIRRPGVDVAGVVEAIGRNVTHLKPGDEVFGTCVGAFAEYATSAVNVRHEIGVSQQTRERDIRAGGRRTSRGMRRI